MLYLDALKGCMSIVSVKCIIVWINDANKTRGDALLDYFLPVFTTLLSLFARVEHELPL